MSEIRQAPGVADNHAAANPFTEFLNPNSMMTPGAAGAFTMVITNTLCQQFALLPLNYTGLAVSFMFGAVVFGYGASLASRLMYFFINSLIIFVVANGSNAIGMRIAQSAAPTKTAAVERLDTGQGKRVTYNIASTDSTAEADKKKEPPKEPPPKPSFFRNWL